MLSFHSTWSSLRRVKFGSWLKRFAMGRFGESFRAAGWRNVVPYPVDYRTGSFTGGVGWDFSSNLEDLNTAIKEWVGRLAYRLTGR
ncbi:MAG: hypothetical protein R3D81_11050 [Thalassovita sp.]